jgi:hypothetical protein
VEPAGGSAPIDERELRAVQGALGILLLAAFVFRIPLLVTGLAIVVVIGAAFGSRFNAFHVVYRTVVGPRLEPARAWVAPIAVRMLDVLAAALLLIAAAAFAVGIDGIGWLFALAEAAVAVVEATTGYNAALELYERVRSR